MNAKKPLTWLSTIATGLSKARDRLMARGSVSNEGAPGEDERVKALSEDEEEVKEDEWVEALLKALSEEEAEEQAEEQEQEQEQEQEEEETWWEEENEEEKRNRWLNDVVNEWFSDWAVAVSGKLLFFCAECELISPFDPPVDPPPDGYAYKAQCPYCGETNKVRFLEPYKVFFYFDRHFSAIFDAFMIGASNPSLEKQMRLQYGLPPEGTVTFMDFAMKLSTLPGKWILVKEQAAWKR